MVDRNHSDLTNIIATGLADNTSGAITAQILRDVMTDTVDTIFAVVPASGTTSTGLGASDGISPVTLGVGSGIHFAAGTNVTTTLSDAGNGSGVVTIGLGPLGNYSNNPNGLMSSFKFGRADSDGGNGSSLTIHDSSGIMLKAGTNMSIDVEDYSANPGSGVFTFNASLPSGNAITSVSAGGDSGFTWTHSSDIVADGAAETLALVAGTGLRLDTDATNNAVRFSVSGSLPLATHPSTTPASSSDNAANTFIQDITLDAYGHITGIGTNTVPSGNYQPVIDSSSRLDASLIGSNGDVSNAEFGYLSNVNSDIQGQIDAKGSGTMSRLKIGASDGLPHLQQLGDGSGLFFAAGDNMTITLSNSDAGSGVLTFASTTVAASASGNAFGAISTGSDIGYTWNNASNVTALAGSQALNIIPASGIRIDTDNTNSAIRLGVSGTLPDLESAPSLASIGTITTGVWNGTTIALDQGGTGATSFGNDEVIYKPNGGSTLSSSSRMKFDGQTFTITHTSGPGITLENTNADENAGLLKFSKDGTSPATNDEIGIIEWSSEDSGSAGTTYAKILGSIADVDAGSEQGALKFFVAELDGTLTEGLTITGIDNDGDITVDVTTHDGANGGLKLGGTLVTATAAELNALDGFTGSSIGSGTMSRLKIGASDGLPQLQQLGDGSGLFFAAGSNMTITLTNNDAGSGILTFASSASGGTATSGNAFTTIAAGGDTGYTWTSQNDIVAGGDADTLKLVAGSGIRLDTDASSNAIRFSASGDYATVASPTFTGTITIGSAEISETELEILDGATLSTTELNYVDGVTSAIQTQLDTKGSGTMSKFHIGSTTQVDPTQISLGDGSGLFFAAGDNMTITTTNTDSSGVITFASTASGGSARSVAGDTDNGLITWVTSDNTFAAESNLTYDGTTLKVAGLQGNNPGVPFIESDGIIYGSGIATGASGLRIAGIAVTSTATELNYVDGVTSAIQTQLDTKGSGTMSRLKIGASDGLPQLQQLGDGSGLFFAAGSNMAITLTNNDAGSGILTFASDVSTNNPTFTGNITIGSAEISETELEILDGATLTTTELNYVDGVTSAIQTQLDTKGSGTMSKLHVGSTTQVDPNQISLGDGSGLFFAAGDNMTITTTNTDGSGVITFASSASGGTAASGNAFTTISAGGDTGYTWTSQNDIVAVNDADTLKLIAGSGIRLDTDASSKAVRFSASGDYATIANPTFTGNITIGSAEISETELEILDGATLTTTELNYVDGVSSAIQTQLDAKAAVASPTFTGVVTTPRLVVTALAGNTGGVPHIDSDGIIYGSGISAGPSGLRINGIAVTSTAAELNIMDGGATVTTPTVAGADAFVMNDGGTMAQVDIDNVDTYLAATTKTLTNKTLTSPTITGPTITGTTTLASGVTIGLQANDTSDGYSLEVAGQIKASGVVTPPITASDAATVTFDLKQSNFHMLTLARASTTLVFADAQPGQRFLTRLTQDGTGSRNVVFPGGISWARAAGQGTPPPPSPTATHSTMYGFICTSGVAAARYYDGFIIGSGIQGTST